MPVVALFGTCPVRLQTSSLHSFSGAAQIRCSTGPAHMGFYGSAAVAATTNAAQLSLIFVASPASARIRPRTLSASLNRAVDLFEAGDNLAYPDAGFARSVLGLRRGADCDNPYGCLAAEDGDPDLKLPALLYGVAQAQAETSASLGIVKPVFSDRPPSCRMETQTSAALGRGVELSGASQAQFSTRDVPTRQTDICGLVVLEIRFEGRAEVQSTTLCCFSDFKVDEPLIGNYGFLADGPAITSIGDSYPLAKNNKAPRYRIFMQGDYYGRPGFLDCLLDTGSPSANDDFKNQLLNAGVEFVTWIYEGDRYPTSGGPKIHNIDPVTLQASADVPRLIDHLANTYSLQQNHPVETYVSIDFETDWLSALSEGRDPANLANDTDFLGSNNRRATSAVVDMLQACQAYFGSNVKLNIYGAPRMYNFVNAPIFTAAPGNFIDSTDWRNATEQNRLKRIDATVVQHGDVLQSFDWHMGSAYDAIPRESSLVANGGTVFQRANSTPFGQPISDFDFESEQDDARHSASIASIYRATGQNTSKPVYELLTGVYIPGIHYRTDMPGPKAVQLIPVPEIVARAQYVKAQNPQVAGVNIWTSGTFTFTTVAFTSTVNPAVDSDTYTLRNSIVRTFYGPGGIGSADDPVANGTFPAWNDAGLKSDVAYRYNARIVNLAEALRQVL